MQTQPPKLPLYGHELLADSLAWLDPRWDDDASLLRLAPYSREAPPKVLHHVRETCCYALGLLLRGDLDRAARAIDAVLKCQFDDPNAPFHGTWPLHPQLPMPGPDAKIWKDYDPNWREFIGTTLIVILSHFENQLPADLVKRIDNALRLACTGALQRNVHADYTNIALMSAFLLDFAGKRFTEPQWAAWSEKLAGEIYTLFQKYNTFSEYNSPTYYGVDIYALALWRCYAPNVKLRAWGKEMEHSLWRDIAQYYHAGMRNIAGPFDRSYGMDMQRYAAGVGLWFWSGIGRKLAPFPDTTKPFDHSHDFSFAPLVAICGVGIPEDAMAHLRAFTGPRQVSHQITETRTATAWLEESLMLGGEWTDGEARAWEQFHPATVHWQHEQEICWMRIKTFAGIDVRVEKNRMLISVPARDDNATRPAFRWLIHVPDANTCGFHASNWTLPGLRVRIENNGFEVSAPKNVGDLMEIACTTAVEKPGSLSLVFEVDQVVD